MKFQKYPTGSADKNYFLPPNEIFSLDLSSGEISLYSYLLRCEDRNTFKCYPSYKTIGKAIQMSKNTVKKYVELLYEKRLIDIEYTSMYTKDGKKFNGNLMYTIRPIQEAIDYNLEKQFEKNMLIQRRAEIAEKLGAAG